LAGLLTESHGVGVARVHRRRPATEITQSCQWAVSGQTHWGRRAGRRRVRRGFTVRLACNTALIGRAADLPSAGLADAIGIHHATNTDGLDWVTAVGATTSLPDSPGTSANTSPDRDRAGRRRSPRCGYGVRTAGL
jgi:hypothetical protein